MTATLVPLTGLAGPDCGHPFCEHPSCNGLLYLTYPGYDEEEVCGIVALLGLEDSAGCDLPPNHRGPHEGPTSLGVRASWSGGGYCAGDPLPVRNFTLLCDRSAGCPARLHWPDCKLGPYAKGYAGGARPPAFPDGLDGPDWIPDHEETRP